MNQHHAVVIVGAGPVGLLAAIELTLAGGRPLVLERLAAPSLAMKAGVRLGNDTDSLSVYCSEQTQTRTNKLSYVVQYPDRHYPNLNKSSYAVK